VIDILYFSHSTYNFNATPRHLIEGFDVGSYEMKQGEKRSLCIPFAEGYGPKGRPPTIPPAATLILDLTCDKVTPPSASSSSRSHLSSIAIE
jgi:FKBP-type peptidyl-prolyl cis-trans isomerase